MPPTTCIQQVSNEYLITCRKKARKTEKSKKRKNNRQNSENKIFEKKPGTYVEKYTEGYLCTKFGRLILIDESTIAKNEFDLLLAVN